MPKKVKAKGWKRRRKKGGRRENDSWKGNKNGIGQKIIYGYGFFEKFIRLDRFARELFCVMVVRLR